MAKRFLTIINVTNLSSDPGSGNDGDIYYNTATDKLRIYANGSWADVSSGGTSGGGVQTDVALSNSWWLGV